MINTGSWFGGDESRPGDEERRVVGSEGIEGNPNDGRIAARQLGQVKAERTHVHREVHPE